MVKVYDNITERYFYIEGSFQSWIKGRDISRFSKCKDKNKDGDNKKEEK